MKKVLLGCMASAIALVGCSQSNEVVKEDDVIKVGMVTDSGTIDDKSFNQGSWQGVLDFQAEHDNVEVQYIKPTGETLQDYTSAIDNLILSGNEVIVMPGFKFDETASVVAEEYPDTEFILIDAEPTKDGEAVAYDNVVSIFFKENEAGFLAGVVSALETKTGKIGYMGGIEVPAVVAYGVGFQYGVEYAKENLGANAEIVEYVYSGTFTDFNVGQTLSAGMFDKGVDVVMATAGVATQGAIAEAKQRGDVYIVGCDSDQYADGLNDKGDSVVLTSAMKRLDVAVATHLEYWLNDEFKGGQVITMDFQQEGVGLPTENVNISEETLSIIEEVKTLMKQGEIEIPCE